jgi:acylphosphatase
MMSLSKWVGAAAFVLLAGTAIVAADTKAPLEKSNSKVTGVVVSVGDGKITVTTDGKDHVLAVAKDADVTCDGKACKLDDLKKGASVSVTLKKDADSPTATRIEAKSAVAAAGAGLHFNAKVDATDDSQLWTMKKEGDYVLLISKSAKAALDVNNEKGNLYLNEKIDPKNNNQLWTIKTEGDYSMIVPKVGAGILEKGALDADNAKDKPYVNAKADVTNNNELWTLETHGDFYLLMPKGHKVALGVSAANTTGSPDKSDNMVTGVVASAGDGKITVTADGKDHILTVARDADVSCDGKACKLEDLKKGASVAVTLKKSGDSTFATKVDAKNRP